MTRHAEMERPDGVQEAEFAHLIHPFTAMFGQPVDELGRIFESVTNAIAGTSHRRPYSRLRERNVFDLTYRPRHMNHRAEGAAS